MVIQGETDKHFLQLWIQSSRRNGLATISNPPTRVSKRWPSMGGLREGQKLFAMTASDGVWVYAASWPWVGRSHLSIRIGIYGADHNMDVRTIFAPDSLKPKS